MIGRVWYVAYGSNLARERLRCYLAGGRPEGAARHYTGCRDTTPARAERPMTLPGGIYFAHTSLTWGGGMAFYDPQLPARTAARAYLLTAGQFADILAQEMRREVGAELDLTEAVRTGRQRLGPGRYETILRVGECDGHPMFTFTAPHGALRADLNAPSAPYLRMLGRGLRESHGWSAERAASYLAACPGARDGWSPRDITGLLAAPSARPEAGLCPDSP